MRFQKYPDTCGRGLRRYSVKKNQCVWALGDNCHCGTENKVSPSNSLLAAL